MIENSTIAAISTAQGNGAIAIIRLSGSESFAICDKIFKSKLGKKISEQKANTIHFGEIVNGNKIIDEVLISVFKSPQSYTGEDSVEISCHGSEFIQQQILNILIKNGAKLANPGEYTQRAFFNGKMDLSQAEGVADLIASNSVASHKIAINQMRGGFSNEISDLRNKLLKFVSLIELELDFGEEEVEFADRTELNKLVLNIKNKIEILIKSFEYGNAIKNGVPVAIIGEPNVGKSTLLNILLNDDKAIVSDIAGTTRDAIEDNTIINGINFRFIDTAGIRETTDTIENLGIKKTFDKIAKAEIILLLIDASTTKEKEVLSQINSIKQRISDNQNLIITFNQIDKVSDYNQINISDLTSVNISAKENINIDILKKVLSKNYKSLDENNIVISNVRHLQALENINSALERAYNGLQSDLPSDLIAMDIRESIHFLGEISGDISTDEILGNIFKNFCIGK